MPVEPNERDDLAKLRHDLHNRATAVAGFAALIADGLGRSPGETARAHLERVRAGVTDMGRILDDWDQVARPDVDGSADAGREPQPKVVGLDTLPLLVVEDDDDHFALLESMLGAAGRRPVWRLMRASTLAEARAILSEGEPVCSLVDLGLPDSGSLDTLVELRSLAPAQPIVVVTGSDSSHGVEAVRLGAQDYLVKSSLSREVLERTIQYAIERARIEERLVHQSLHDSMTGLANRALLFDRLTLAVARLDHHPSPLAVMFIDLDRFKIINDSLGHQAGDELLVQVARRIRSMVRRADTVARVGGDEFVVLCEDLADVAVTGRIADQLLRVFAEPFRCRGNPQTLTASIGVALASVPNVSPDVLLANADTAMYRAKEKGRARWELFDEGMRTRLVKLFQIERELATAVVRDELELWYQPIVEMGNGAVIGAEALVRWRHPDRGLLLPAEFLPVAEECGRIREMGEWIVSEACAQAGRWAQSGILPDAFTMWVNVSSRQLESPRLEKAVAAALDGTPTGWRLGLEITEGTLINDLEHVAGILAELRRSGVQIAIDDFGTGFSSLSWLHRLPIDQLKIDGSFVADLTGSGPNDAIVAACIGLGEALDISCTAECIELPRQAEALRSLHCQAAQGYLYSPPLTADAAGERIASGVLTVA